MAGRSDRAGLGNPPNGDAPFVSEQIWHRVARPYLQLTVLNNGYHFYAPEPGPAALVWLSEPTIVLPGAAKRGMCTG